MLRTSQKLHGIVYAHLHIYVYFYMQLNKRGECVALLNVTENRQNPTCAGMQTFDLS